MTDFKILSKDSNLRKSILKASSNDRSRTIMNYIIEKRKSIVDIVKNRDISMTVIHRRVHLKKIKF